MENLGSFWLIFQCKAKFCKYCNYASKGDRNFFSRCSYEFGHFILKNHARAPKGHLQREIDMLGGGWWSIFFRSRFGTKIWKTWTQFGSFSNDKQSFVSTVTMHPKAIAIFFLSVVMHFDTLFRKTRQELLKEVYSET